VCPAPLSLFEKFRSRGYHGQADAPWNPIAKISSLPAVTQRLAAINKRRDVAKAALASITPVEEEFVNEYCTDDHANSERTFQYRRGTILRSRRT